MSFHQNTTERVFTAREVQSALEAVILYERARTEQVLRVCTASFDAAIRANRASVKSSHLPLEEIIRAAR